MQSYLTWVATENEDLAISSEVVQEDGLELLVAIPDKQSVRAGSSLSWEHRCVWSEEAGTIDLVYLGS